jgi:hypothetical protein
VVEFVGPLAHALESVIRRPILPIAEQLRDAARFEMCCRPTDDRFDECVTHHSAVAVLVLGNARGPRRDHERRVRHDPVEPLARNGLEEAAVAELDAVDAVELDVEACEAEGPFRDVGRHDVGREPRGVHRLDPAPGAEVEHSRRGSRQHQAAERHRRPADPEHVLLAERVPERELAEVREDPPLDRAERIGERVRPEVECSSHGCRVERSRGIADGVGSTGGREQPELRGTIHAERRQRVLGLGARHVETEHEQLGERREVGGIPVLGAAGIEHASCRYSLAAMQRRRGIRSPQLFERGDRVVRASEVGAEPPQQVGRAFCARPDAAFGAHPSIQAHETSSRGRHLPYTSGDRV